MAENNEKNGYLIGVDVGGTKILGGIFDSSLRLLGSTKTSTKTQRGPQAVIERIAQCVRNTIDEADVSIKDVRGVGVGAPGAVDISTGNIIFAPNLDWRDVPLQKPLEKMLGLPVFVENDGNVATLGVHVVEMKAKPRHLLGIFVGTGIGGGIILNGELFRGIGHTAGEVGHMVLELDGPECGCGNKGCFESLASRTAMFQQIKAAIREGQKTVLTEMLEDLDKLRSGDLRKALRRGDKLVERVVEQAARYIGVAIANLVNVLNPEVVVLGGGVMEALADDMLGIIMATAKDYAMPGSMIGLQIVTSSLGDNAGIQGAAVLAKRLTKDAL
jgi:glucokinase